MSKLYFLAQVSKPFILMNITMHLSFCLSHYSHLGIKCSRIALLQMSGCLNGTWTNRLLLLLLLLLLLCRHNPKRRLKLELHFLPQCEVRHLLDRGAGRLVVSNVPTSSPLFTHGCPTTTHLLSNVALPCSNNTSSSPSPDSPPAEGARESFSLTSLIGCDLQIGSTKLQLLVSF